MINQVNSKLRLLSVALTLGLAFLLSACQPTPPATPTTSAQAPTAAPTDTRLPPTPTPTLTNTPLPPTATSTATPEPTSTPLPTATSLPPSPLPLVSPSPLPPTDTPTPAVDDAPMVRVPAGEFIMGTSYEQMMELRRQYITEYPRLSQPSDFYFNEVPQRILYLDEFYIDQYEVTNARYRRCVEAGACQPPHSSKGFPPQEHYYDDPAYDNYPVIWVSWHHADAYCRWVGKRLPTEVEWEKAARGTDGRLWPWGNEWEKGRANVIDVRGTTPVGSYPSGASPYGAMDMAGNVWEWVDDWYLPYPGSGYQSEDFGQKHKVLRGGAWNSVKFEVRTAYRLSYHPPDAVDPVFGFRCVSAGARPTPEPTWTPQPTVPPDLSRAMAEVPAGEFIMGAADDDPDARDDEKPQHTVYLDTFYIDKYEVTNAQYVEFLNAIGGHWQACEGKDCVQTKGEDPNIRNNRIIYADGHYWVEEGYENHPVVKVSWYGADAYCQYYGLRLPTEAEWEKAARGTDGRLYPWGNEWDPDKVAETKEDLSGVHLSPVGSRPEGASPYGAMDMAGNVWEWVADWYTPDYYSQSPAHNPQGPLSGYDKVIRGGSQSQSGRNLRTTTRIGAFPDSGGSSIGFRCAHTAK